MMKYLRHMTVFTKVVECGSISSAADELNLSKSVVSQQLKTLEQELGTHLLNRTTRRQVLTPVGRDFYHRCSEMKQISEQAWSDVRESQSSPGGSITISAPHALMDSVIAPAIGQLAAQYPEIKPTILADDERAHLIEDDIDVAVRVGESPESNFRQRLLGQFREVLCASPGYLEKHSIQPSQWIDHSDDLCKCDYIANAWQGKHLRHSLYHGATGDKVSLLHILVTLEHLFWQRLNTHSGCDRRSLRMWEVL